jgi:hypothetical protein
VDPEYAPLEVTAVEAGTDKLPNWISFNVLIYRLSGTPNLAEYKKNYTIILSVKDGINDVTN